MRSGEGAFVDKCLKGKEHRDMAENFQNEKQNKDGIHLTLKQAVKRELRWVVILVPVLIFFTLIVIGILAPEKFLKVLNQCFTELMINGGWLISLGTLLFVIFMLVILFHPVGKVKLGGKDAKPEYSTWNWFAISLCAGIGTGIVFWGAVEPLLFTVQPQMNSGIEANSREAVIWALSKSYLHWSFAPYACYGIFGLCIAYAVYNLKKNYSVSSAFAPVLGNITEKKWFQEIVDTLTVFAITGGVAGSLGYGLLQIASGFHTVFGIEKNVFLYIAICIVIVVAYNTSSITGMDKGIRWLSDKNAWMFLILMLLAFFAGPTSWICNLFVESAGSFVSTFVESITSTAAFADTGKVIGSIWNENSELWSQWWDQYYFVDFLAFAPVTGLFLIKLAKGRTLREFVIINWIVPSVFGMIWFAIFGGLALDIQYNYAAYADRVNLEGCLSLFDYMQKFGNEAMMLKVVEVIPFSDIIKPIVLLLIILSFVTLADSMTSTVALMTIRNNVGVNEAPASIKMMWGLIMGITALVFTLTGNIEGIKIVKTLSGFPILIMGLVMVILFFLYIVKHGKDNEIRASIDEP